MIKKLAVLLVVSLVLGLSIVAVAGTGSKVIVSNGTESGAVCTYDGNSAWTADFEGACWIWSSSEVQNPNETTTETFQESFNLNGMPGDATLQIAVDNGLELFINNDRVYYSDPDDPSDDIYDGDIITLDSSYFKPGGNVLEAEVQNNGSSGSNYKSNPAGVMYRLVIDYEKGGCNNGVGNGPEGCNPGNAPNNDEPDEETDEKYGPGNPGNKGGSKK